MFILFCISICSSAPFFLPCVEYLRGRNILLRRFSLSWTGVTWEKRCPLWCIKNRPLFPTSSRLSMFYLGIQSNCRKLVLMSLRSHARWVLSPPPPPLPVYSSIAFRIPTCRTLLLSPSMHVLYSLITGCNGQHSARETILHPGRFCALELWLTAGFYPPP